MQPVVGILVTLMLAGRTCMAAEDSPRAAVLAPVFQDHMVLQRERSIAVWGDAAPGDVVTIEFASRSVQARADGSGHWRAELPRLDAGGPYLLEAHSRSGSVQSVSDVLVGDVWLCSGQSNMEMDVSASLNAERELAAARNPRIRLLHLDHDTAPAPRRSFAAAGGWRLVTPESVKQFSAVCYFFARELQKSVDVPFGLIESSWGGSAIESWISGAGLRALGGYADRLDLLGVYAKSAVAGERALADAWERWWHSRTSPASSPWLAAAAAGGDWRDVPEPMRDWKTWGVPELAEHDGMVWFRRSVTLTAAQASGPARLALGAIDEVDQTWLNGTPVGNSFGWGTERTYDLPAGILRAGENSIVVNVLSVWDAGGMYGPPDHMRLVLADGSAVALGGGWRYQFVPESVGLPQRAPWQSIGGLTSIYNAMIAPLQPFGLRGVAWYQGESNTGDAAHYGRLLTTLMADWRRGFEADLPFLVVQLPNFGTRTTSPTPSGWAELREAQRRAVAADRNAALAVTIDLGDWHELHPQDKQDVGERLSRAARALVYGSPASPSGPVPADARRDAGRVIVRFGGVNGHLAVHGGTAPIGFELCGPGESSCRYADAVMARDDVVLSGEAVAGATRVRYCWGDSPLCNLYDTSGLPAAPFEQPLD